MKKIKFLLPAMTGFAALGAIAPTLSSCNKQNKYHRQAVELTEEAINEFFELCKVPHFSYKLDAIRAYYKKWIKKYGFTFNRDEYGNIWFDVPATDGYQNYNKLIIQCHMDMVFDCSDKTKTTEDITKIEPVRDGDLIYTKNHYTSLGADNSAGIGVMLAIAKSQTLKHGPIRMLITADEEEGMIGASKLEGRKDVIDSDYLINIDAEDEDQMVVSNAGGANWAYDVQKFDDSEDKMHVTTATPGHIFTLTIKDCLGGHSGDGPKNGHMNCVEQMAKLFMGSDFIESAGESKLWLISADTPGVTVGNKIPTDLVLKFFTKSFTLDQLKEKIDPWFKSLKSQFPVETKMTCKIEQDPAPTENFTTLSGKASYGILNMINNFQTKFEFLEDGKTLKTSGNIAPFILNLNAEGTEAKPQFASTNWTRSVDSEKLKEQETKGEATYATLKTYVKGATEINKKSTYPAWWPKQTNKIIDSYSQGLRQAGGKPQLQDIHGGVEVSWWNKIRPGINQTSVGPQIDNAHTCKETFHISTYTKMIEAILYVIDNLK